MCRQNCYDVFFEILGSQSILFLKSQNKMSNNIIELLIIIILKVLNDSFYVLIHCKIFVNTRT